MKNDALLKSFSKQGVIALSVVACACCMSASEGKTEILRSTQAVCPIDSGQLISLKGTEEPPDTTYFMRGN